MIEERAIILHAEDTEVKSSNSIINQLLISILISLVATKFKRGRGG
jgi:hypothetical protein